MSQCQYIKPDGQSCTRQASIKVDHNPVYCWQHQNLSEEVAEPASIKVVEKNVAPIDAVIKLSENIDAVIKLSENIDAIIKPSDFLVFYHDDDGTRLFCLPRHIADLEESKMVINAIIGKDDKYNPYTGLVFSKTDQEYFAKIQSILEQWGTKYLVPENSLTSSFAFGNGYQ